MAVLSRGLKCSRTTCTLRFQSAGRLAIEPKLLFLRQLLITNNQFCVVDSGLQVEKKIISAYQP